MKEDDTALRNACKKDRKFNDAKMLEFNSVHTVLHSTEYTQDEKYFILITDFRFSSDRAQELVYGQKIFRKPKYQNKEEKKGVERFYAN